MLDGVFVNAYLLPAFDKKEILRYAGCKEGDAQIEALLDECLQECEGIFASRVCYRVWEAESFLQTFSEESKALKKNLKDCQFAVAFAATAGLPIDRLIARCAASSTVKALLFQAIGAERVEALCDAFCEDIKLQAKGKGYEIRPRFSPGYGDFPLQAQKPLCASLDCARKIGLTLTDALLLSPSKSVTAVIGIACQK